MTAQNSSNLWVRLSTTSGKRKTIHWTTSFYVEE